MAPSSDELRIVLVGKSGAGKSATGNTILRSKAFTEDPSFESVTNSSSNYSGMVFGRKVLVVDTPGLYDTSKTEEDVKTEIEKCVNLSMPGPHVFLLVIRLGVRFTAEEENAVKWIQEHFGKRASQFTILLFTHVDQLNGKKPKDIFNKKINDLIKSCDDRYHAFDNRDRKDKTQVEKLLQKIDFLVNEINDKEHYTNGMYQEAQRKMEEEKEKMRQEEEKRRKEHEEEMQKQKREREERIRKEERERSIKKQKEKEEEEQKQGKRRWVCSVIGGGVGAGLGAFISVFTASPVGLAIGATTGSNLADHLCYWAA